MTVDGGYLCCEFARLACGPLYSAVGLWVFVMSCDLLTPVVVWCGASRLLVQ